MGELRKKEKTNGLVGLKTGGGVGQPKEKRETNGLVGLETGGGRANLRKREKLMISGG